MLSRISGAAGCHALVTRQCNLTWTGFWDGNFWRVISMDEFLHSFLILHSAFLCARREESLVRKCANNNFSFRQCRNHLLRPCVSYSMADWTPFYPCFIWGTGAEIPLILMTRCYLDLCWSNFELTGWNECSANQKHYPDLGSDRSSVWTNFCTRFSYFILRWNHLSGVAKCRLFSPAEWEAAVYID